MSSGVKFQRAKTELLLLLLSLAYYIICFLAICAEQNEIVDLFGCSVLTVCSGSDTSVRFIQEPNDAVVSQGQRTVLHCAVDNVVGPVQWLRDGFGLGIGPTFEGYPRYTVDMDTHRGRPLTYTLIH